MEHPTLLRLRDLPAGYKFDPTDQIILDTLKDKILGDPLSGCDVLELNICDCNPRDLFDRFKGLEHLYFFGKCEYYDNSKLRKRKIRDGGTWKSTGDLRQIALYDDDDEIIGTKRTLVYNNAADDAEFVAIEYSYTAQLDRPATGDYVLHKVSRKPNNKKAASKKSGKAEPVCKNPMPNKKARKGESSNCNAASASASANKNSKDLMAKPANGDGAQSNHMASDLDKMTAISTYEKASDFDDQGRYKMASTSASKTGAGSHLMDSLNFDQRMTVSTNSEGGTVVSRLESGIPNETTEMPLYKTRRQSCLIAPCLENHNSCEVTTFSSRNKDETSFPGNYGFDQNPNYRTTDLFYDKSSCPVTSDFGVQNPCEKVNISASDVGERSPLTAMPSDFDNQNQFQKTDISVLQDTGRSLLASRVGETVVQVDQSRYKTTNTPNLEDFSGSLKASSVREAAFEEVQSQFMTDMLNLKDDFGFLVEDSASPMLPEISGSPESVMPEPIDTNGNPTDSALDAPSNCEKTDISTLTDNQSPLSDFGVGESISFGSEEIREIFTFFELAAATAAASG